VYTSKHADEKSQCAEPKNWQEWGSFSWCRTLEWIDAERVIAIFTVILGVATWALFVATRNLVRGAEQTAERQLRAYVSDSPEEIIFNMDNKSAKIKASFVSKNHGQTPAFNLRHFTFYYKFDRSIPDDFQFPDPRPQQNVTSQAVIFPNAEIPVGGREIELSHTELNDLAEENKRLYIMAIVLYQDVFRASHWTRVCVFIPGKDFKASLEHVAAERVRTGQKVSIPIVFEHGERYNDTDQSEDWPLPYPHDARS
jgi:hypothetical protein